MTLRRILTPRAIMALAALLTAGSAFVTACTPALNSILQAVRPGEKPIPVLPVSETPTAVIHAAPSTAAPTEPHVGPPDRDLPY